MSDLFVPMPSLYPNTLQYHPPFYIDPYSNQALYLCRPDKDYFCIGDIGRRYDVIRKFMEHTDKVCKMLLQTGSKAAFGHISNGRFSIATKMPMYDWPPIMPGGWVDWNRGFCGPDIISLYAYQANINYHSALNELLDAFSKKENFGDHKSKTKWHIQEKNPIAIDLTTNMNLSFPVYFNSPFSTHQYLNRHGRSIGTVLKFNLRDGSEAEVFYTIWRQYKSEELKIVSLFPEKPYMIYNEHLMNDNVRLIKFENNEMLADKSQQYYDRYDLVYSACPGGLKNLLNADISYLNNKDIIIDFDDKLYNFAFIDALKNKCEKENSQLFINFTETRLSEMGYDFEIDASSYLFGTSHDNHNHDTRLSATNILSEPERHGLQAPAIEIEQKKTPGFADIGEEIPGADRKVRVLVEPIIESNSITWLFSAEKVGKTLLGLSIAYAAAKGHRPIGAWSVDAPCNVLYIDGEMPGHKLTETIEKIMNGYNDQGPRPFSLYSFFEADFDYDSIIDEEWQKEWNPRIATYDLVILDNYYSLNENRVNIKPFIRWLKSHSRKGVAFLILDHTNAEGDLQGSITKRRAADLGILLEKLEQNEINVSYQFDRYGVESKSSPHTLMPCFTSSEFQLKLSTEPQQEPGGKKLNTRLELYAYLLALEAQGKTPSEIVAQTGMKRATVDNYLNAFKPERELTKSQKGSRPQITPQDKKLVFVEKERLMKLTDDELAQRLEDFQNSELSRLFQG